MSKKKKMIPELRFPEFENDGEWKIEPLGNLSNEIVEKTKGRNYKLMSITSGFGLVSQIEKFGREIAGNSYKNYYVIRNGDFAYNKSSTKLYSEGEIAMFDDDQIGAVPNSIFTCFRFNENKIYPHFAKYPFINNLHGSWLRKFISVGARANGALQVKSKDLFSVPFPYPNLLEQQKIANCLSSLDDLITAYKDKLVALEAHKKGLMQNLFPQELQKVPNFRFPEFEKYGNWFKKELGQLGHLINGLTYKPEDVRNEGLLVLRSSNIRDTSIDLEDCVFVNSKIKGANISAPNDILICVRNGSKRLIGKNALIPDNIPTATHGAFMTVFRAKYPEFVFQLFQSNTYRKQVKADLGATINSINGKNLIKYSFFVPKPEEQQKIAACLSSIDDLLNAQQDKIEQLERHKKGLLQGLFPKID